MTTLTFLSLFLGLTTGLHPVNVDVDGPAAVVSELRVEVLLDGETCGVREEPPWRFECDFGEELAPHDLQVRALDAEDTEIASARQLVNLAPRQSAVEMTLERDGEARVQALRLAWRSVAFPAPSSVQVTLNGEPLPVEDPRRIPVPPLDPDRLHFAVAELTFPDGGRARTEIAFGGTWGDTVSSQNTAVPVVVEGDRKLRRASDAAGLLVSRDGGGESAALEPVAVESGRADVVAVVDSSATPELASMKGDFSGFHDRDVQAGLEGQDRLYLVDPVPRRLEGPGGSWDVFVTSPPREAAHGGLGWQLTHFHHPEGKPQRLSDAVALAAMQAAAGGRPRSVLLILGPAPRDDSDHSPAEVRRFLERLRVPLEVWWVERPIRELPRRERGQALRQRHRFREQRESLSADWGEARRLAELQSILDASRELRRELDRQHVLWVEGVHLPTEVEMADGVEGARLLGVPPETAEAEAEPGPAPPTPPPATPGPGPGWPG